MEEQIGLFLRDLLDKQKVEEQDLMIIEDSQNTKKCTVRDFISSITANADDEQPATYRIFSSKKVQELIDEVKGKLPGDDSDSVGITVEELNRIKADIDYVDKIRDALLIKIEDTSVSDALLDEISAKRDKSTKLTWTDFDISSDEYKIRLENLSQSVIDTMLGATPIPTNRAPKGGWVTEDIADKAIKFKKLSNDYRYGGHFIEGNINEFLDEGIFTLGYKVIGLPKENPNDKEMRLLTVTRTGNGIVKQVVEYTNDLEYRPIYRRIASENRIRMAEFIKVEEINQKFLINRTMLSEDFSNCGEIEDCDIFSVTKEGHYITGNNVLNLPHRNGPFLVDIKKYGSRYIYTANAIDINNCVIYQAMQYYTTGMNLEHSQWYNISSHSRSKFEGKTVHLFGDGILFGLGSSDIPNKSIPALLYSKYGLRVFNHALGDATLGNYGDDIFAERSVLTQITLEPLTDADYVILMVGTNDFKSGKVSIGTDDEYHDLSFKGSLNLAIRTILEKNSNCKILLLSPIFRSRISSGDFRNSDEYSMNDLYLKDFAKAMEDISEIHHIPFLDLYRTGGINKYNSATYLKDGLYLNDTGHEYISSKIMDAMNMYY